MSDKIPQRIMDEAEREYPMPESTGMYLSSDIWTSKEINDLKREEYIKGRMKSDGELIELVTWFNLDSLKLNPCTDSANVRKWWSDKDNRSYNSDEVLELFLQSKQNK